MYTISVYEFKKNNYCPKLGIDLWTPTAKVNEEKSKNVETLIQKFQHTTSDENPVKEKTHEPSLPPKYSKWPDQKVVIEREMKPTLDLKICST